MTRPPTALEDALTTLRAAGLRVTDPRKAVLVWLIEHPHSTVQDMSAGVRVRGFGSVSTQALYDVLDACRAAGLVRRIEPAGHPARFERRVDGHHHVVCRRCGRVEDVDRVVGPKPCLTPREDHGFAVDEAEVVFWGFCPQCAATRRSDQ
jgi:Fur family ferric uptake transcriptional regulator